MENQPTAPNPPPAFDSSSTPSSNHSMPGFSRMGHGWNPPTNASELFRKEIGSDWASRQGLWFTHPMAPQVYSDSSRGYIQDPMVVLWDQIRQAYYRLESRQGVQSLHQLASNFYSLIELKNTHVELFGESATDEAKIFEACQVGNRWSQSTGQGLFIFKQDPSQPNIILARFEEPITNPLRQPPAPNMPSLPRGVVPMVHPLNPQAGLYGDAYLDSIMTHNYPTASNVANIFGPPPPTSSRKASGPSTSNVDLGVNGVLS
ncbi:hypothetical protein K493DRAFT_34474 [Basidiobolus meristosporus CBS 931.73]|uniref:Uncharacterized protein n=1 Tax=Basidiobolus meristosporus CBS 931.73 TaxID=1314790 RepID=A0A1Y1Y6U3_9FUNG|nr:hypothetical protein K493DRAFT_34474 [Basidiobolus meristosporus CBS 931.73]|eukprot:ORX93727.1 hypothetical protein K493DRAFT_34474 [Basidiobolus meristosporus CBS 931.73]